MTRERHLLDSEKTGSNKDINVSLDRALITVQALRNCSYGGWVCVTA
jgi:hypothetical protein